MGSQRKPLRTETGAGSVRDGEARTAHRGVTHPASGRVADAAGRLTMLQRTAGNRAVASLLGGDPDQLASSVPRSGGSPLAPPVLRSFERAFDTDLSTVRVHTGPAAEHSAAAWSATAYTAGEHVVFGQGAYAPGTSHGNHLLAHELAHVVQQRSGAVRGQRVPGTAMEVSDPGDASEREADVVARQVTSRLSSGTAD